MPQNLSAQAQKFWISCEKRLHLASAVRGLTDLQNSEGGLLPPPPQTPRSYIFARLRGNLNSEATSKSLFILPYYGKC